MKTWRIKLPYNLSVRAPDDGTAFDEAIKLLKSMPVQGLIMGVEDASLPKKMSLLRRLITGK
jgi:hypothetical protein